MKKIILVLVFIMCEAAAFGAGTFLDINISGGLNFGYMVIPDTGINSLTVPANSSGVRVSFVTYDHPDDTVSVAFSGVNVSGNGLLMDSGNISVDFTSSSEGWTNIRVGDGDLYIGGTMSITDSATGDNSINESITITVTIENIN